MSFGDMIAQTEPAPLREATLPTTLVLAYRRQRAMMLTGHIMGLIGGLIDHDAARDVHDALYKVFFESGAEVISDADRRAAGLPPRDENGLTSEELYLLPRCRGVRRRPDPRQGSLDTERNMSSEQQAINRHMSRVIHRMVRRRSPRAPRVIVQITLAMRPQALPPRERKYIHDAVRKLRKQGRTVYRHGAWHCVDGRHLSNRQLLKVSRS